jgi:hypothetical protein
MEVYRGVFEGRARLNVCALTRHAPMDEFVDQEDVMAKGQMRSNKEKKKPKAEWNKKKPAPNPSPFALGQAQSKPANAKKG